MNGDRIKEIQAWERIEHLVDCVHCGTVTINMDADIFDDKSHEYSVRVILTTIIDYACQGLGLPFPSSK